MMTKQGLTWVFSLLVALAVPISGAMATTGYESSEGGGGAEPSGSPGDQGDTDVSQGNAGDGHGGPGVGGDQSGKKGAGEIGIRR